MNSRPGSSLTSILARFRVLVHDHGPRGFAQIFGLRYLIKWGLLSLLIGLASGFGAVALQKGIEFATSIFLGNIGFVPPQPAGEGHIAVVIPAVRWLIPAVTAIGGLIAGILIFKLLPNEESRGADRVIESFHHHDGNMPWHVPYVELVASAITMGSGGSAGPEGPAAVLGSGFSSLIARWLHLSAHDKRIIVAAAMGAGIGAIFKAPLGGAILGTEMLYLWGIEIDVLVPAFISSMIAYVVFASFFGYTPIFGTGLNLVYGDSFSLVFYALLGIGCGLGGILYARAFHGLRYLSEKIRIKNWLKPAIGGLLAGLIGIALPQSLGIGLGWMQMLMSPEGLGFGAGLLLLLVLAKIGSTALTVGSGGGGGVYAPGIVIGGFLGASMWEAMRLLPHMPVSPAAFVIVGMMAFFGAIGHAPLAVMIMIAEITGSYQLLLPAMIAVGIATAIVGRTTIYGSQVSSPIESPAHKEEYSYPLLNRLLVSEAMTTGPITIGPGDTVTKAAHLMHEYYIKALPVIDTIGVLVGIVANVDVVRIPKELHQTTRVEQIMTRNLVVIHPEDKLDYAMELMTRHHVGHLLVVSANEPAKMYGIITTSDVVTAYLHRQENNHDENSGIKKPNIVSQINYLIHGRR